MLRTSLAALAQIGVLAAVFVGAPAYATCTSGDVDHSESGTGTLTTFTCTEGASNEFDIYIEAAGSTGGFTVTVETFDDAVITNVTVKSTGASNTYVRVHV